MVYWFRYWKSGRSVIENANDAPVVFVQRMEGVTTLNPSRNGVRSDELPRQLVVQKGFYCFGNAVYDCTISGVYRFVDPQKTNCQHIVLDEDPIGNALLVSFLCLRGNRDSDYMQQQLEKFSVNRFLSLTCGPACIFAESLLNAQGYRSRVVYSHTIGELNSYNNGHVLLEVFSTSLCQYVAVDMDKKCLFRVNGKLSSLYEYSKALFEDEEIAIDFFSQTTTIDYMGFVERASNFSYDFIEHAVYSEKAGLTDYLARICQVPMMMDDDKTFVCAWDEVNESRLREINSDWQILDRQNFFDMFYSQQ